MIARYEYDALNRRTKEFINADTDDDFDSFRHFYYTFGWQLLETRLSDSENTEPQTLQPEVQYVWSARYLDAPVLRDKNTDTDDLCDDQRLYYANDANMNVTALLATDGTPLERYVYDPYGKVTIYDDDWSETRNTSSYDNSILFCGYYHDWETGLYHVRNRYYHPHLGWITRDPAGYADGMSLYEYCRSGPLGVTDAMGLCTAPGQPGAAAEGDGSKTAKDSADQVIGDLENGRIKDVDELKERAKGLSKEEQAQLARRLREKYPQSGGVDTRNRSTGQSQFDWEKGLKDYGNPFWGKDAPYAELLSGLNSEVSRAAEEHLKMSPEARAMWDAKYEQETTYTETWVSGEWALSLEGSAGIANTFNIGLRVSTRADGPGFKVGWYVEPGLGGGSPSASACFHSGVSVVRRERSMLDIAPESSTFSYWHGNGGGNVGVGVTLGGVLGGTKSMDGKTRSYGGAVEIGAGALPVGSGHVVGGPGVEVKIYSWPD
ncbi:MAG: RHS repeat-associated core domain-containing protein [Planctomycetota bacterium]|nr:RHS repeat-associated core domain-containing protein [Planctomycetota bacterium]